MKPVLLVHIVHLASLDTNSILLTLHVLSVAGLALSVILIVVDNVLLDIILTLAHVVFAHQIVLLALIQQSALAVFKDSIFLQPILA